MFVINYSKDILYLVLAFCVLWLTFFITWLVYYLVAAARQLYRASQIVKEQTSEVAGIIKKIKLAIELPTSIISLLIEGFKKIAELGVDVMGKRDGSKQTNRRKNSQDKPKNEKEQEDIF